MISDNDLYRLAIFLGSAAMLMILLYHFLEVNATEDAEVDAKSAIASESQSDSKSKSAAGK